MNVLIDFCILIGCVLAGFFCVWRSHYNFERGHVRIGYIYIMMAAFFIMLFIYQSFRF